MTPAARVWSSPPCPPWCRRWAGMRIIILLLLLLLITIRYEDVAIDQFGRELAICDLAEGFIPQATQRAIGRDF